jgi:hypothetical protein
VAILVTPTPGQPKAAVGLLAQGYAAVVVSLRLLIIAGWAAAVAAAIVFLPPLNPTTGGLSELIPPAVASLNPMLAASGGAARFVLVEKTDPLDDQQRSLAAQPFEDDAARRWLEYRPRRPTRRVHRPDERDPAQGRAPAAGHRPQ